MVAPATRNSVGHVYGCRFFAFKCCPLVGCRLFVSKLCRLSSCGTRKHTASRVRVQTVRGLGRQAERTATLTLVSCALLLLLLLLLLSLLPPLCLLLLLLLTIFIVTGVNPNVTGTFDRVRRCSFVLVQHNKPYSPSMMRRRFDFCGY